MATRAELRARISLDTKSATAAMTAFQKSVRSFGTNIGAPMVRVGRNLAMTGGVIGAAGVGLGTLGLRAAGQLQALQLRLKGAIGDARRAETAFRETFEVFAATPLDLGPLVEARTLLESVGVTGKKALEGVAAAAAVTGRQVTDVASAIVGMEAEPLRRLGIQAKKTGEQFQFTFRNTLGKEVTTWARGLSEARTALTGILAGKYSGALGEMSRSWEGRLSTFRGLVWAGWATLWSGLRDRLSPILGKINEKLEQLLKSGALQRWGESMAQVAGKVGGFMVGIRDAWTKLDGDSKAALTNVLAGSVAFAAAWHVGLVQEVAKGVLRMTTTSVVGFATMTKVMTAFAGLVVGWKLGKALDKAFDTSTWYAVFIERIMSIGRQIAQLFDSLRHPNWSEAQRQEWVKAVAAEKAATEERIAYIKRAAMRERQALGDISFADALEHEFATVDGWVETLPKSLQNAIRAATQGVQAVGMDWPELKFPGIDDAAGAAGDMADALGRAAAAAAPIRGFLTGAYSQRQGIPGLAEALAAPGRGRRGSVMPGWQFERALTEPAQGTPAEIARFMKVADTAPVVKAIRKTNEILYEIGQRPDWTFSR